MFIIHVCRFMMCVLFCFSFIWLHVYVFAIKYMVHCWSAFEPGASGLPYYCTSTCVRSWCNWRASCVAAKHTQKNPSIHNWSSESLQHLLDATKFAFSARQLMSLCFGICNFSKIFWNSDYHQRFPIKSTDIWSYRIQPTCVLSFHLHS